MKRTKRRVSAGSVLYQAGIRYLDEDGYEYLAPAAAVSTLEFERCRPAREIPSYAGQRHTPGRYWCATADDLLGYESYLEARWLRLVDFDPAIAAIATQPFEVSGRDTAGEWRHVPDIYTRRADGRVEVIDVKNPLQLDEPRVKRQAERTQAFCEALGWGYRMVGEPPSQLSANVGWLAGYRRPLGPAAARLVPAILAAATQPITIGALAQTQQMRELARPAIYHLLWHHRLACDLELPLRERTLIRTGTKEQRH